MRSSVFFNGLCGTLIAAGIFASAPRPAAAEESVALDRFHPSFAGDRMFGVASPYTPGGLGVHAMLLGDYAHNPLVLRSTSDDSAVGAIVGSQLFVHLNGTLTLFNRLAVNVDVPVALVQSGDNPSPDAANSFISPSSAAFGDLRVGARVRLFGGYFDALQLALGGMIWLPTGSSADNTYVSDGDLRGNAQVILGGRADRYVWSGSLGFDFRSGKSFAGIDLGTGIIGSAGLGILLGDERQIQLGPELTVGSIFAGSGEAAGNAEILLDARYRFLHNFELGVGAGPGLSRGFGTPDVRAIFMAAYTPEQKKEPEDRDKDRIIDEKDACPDVAGVASEDAKLNGCPKPPEAPPPDRDKDSILDMNDACPDVPGLPNEDAKKNGCPPPPDRDKDTIIDDVDACPDVVGVANEDAKKNGCPPDKDNDGVIDEKDACIDIPGLKTEDPATNGCPGDTDGDGIRDDKDACINDKGKEDPDPKKNGCPTVRVGAEEVYILEQVQFDTDKAKIKKVSFPLLDNVAAVLKEHAELTKMEVQGHTDNVGGDKHNMTLSTSRANAVMAALITRGVQAKRLVAKGYGQTVPIASNDTEEGRAQNRRVQFKIVEKKAAAVAPPAAPDAKPEAKPEVKPEAKPAAKPEVKPAPKPEAKPEVKPAPKPAAKPEAKPAPKPAVKPAPKPAPKK